MKELSIAEKAKRFDMVIEKLRNFYRDYDTVSRLIDVKEELANLIPELKESEDERIKREIINYLSTVDDKELISYESWIAWLEKQGEQKETPCDKCKKEQPSHSCQDITELGRCALEKQNEQKPGVKIKPKFHEGEWVILTAGELSTTLQIGKVDTDKKLYWFNDDSYLPVVDEECLHRWTIQDAKDGDVLVDDMGVILFRKIGNEKYEDAVDYHCVVDTSGKFEKQEGLSYWGLSTYALLRPATKKQRDVLFAKMRESGYKWDAEKKELKKIEQKPAWSEEDGDYLRIAINATKDTFPMTANWLKSLKDRIGG